MASLPLVSGGDRHASSGEIDQQDYHLHENLHISDFTSTVNAQVDRLDRAPLDGAAREIVCEKSAPAPATARKGRRVLRKLVSSLLTPFRSAPQNGLTQLPSLVRVRPRHDLLHRVADGEARGLGARRKLLQAFRDPSKLAPLEKTRDTKVEKALNNPKLFKQYQEAVKLYKERMQERQEHQHQH